MCVKKNMFINNLQHNFGGDLQVCGASSCLCVLTGAVSWAGLALCADLFPLCDMSRN